MEFHFTDCDERYTNLFSCYNFVVEKPTFIPSSSENNLKFCDWNELKFEFERESNR